MWGAAVAVAWLLVPAVAAADVSISALSVDGRSLTLPVPPSQPVRIPSTARRLSIAVQGSAEAGSSERESGALQPRGTRLRYRLDPLDSSWRDAKVSIKVDILFVDDADAVVGSKELLVEASATDWTGDPDASIWTPHEIRATAPPLAAGAYVNFLTAPNVALIGMIGIDQIRIRVVGQGGAERLSKAPLAEFDVASFHPLATPKGWRRLGSRSEISQLRLRSAPTPHAILALLDDDPRRFGNWATAEPFPVRPGDLVTLAWTMSSSCGLGGSVTADYDGLEAGNYVFRAAAFKPGNAATGVEMSVDIKLYTPFYMRRDVWAGAALLGLAAMAMAVRAATVRRMKRRLAEVEREHALERERARIARDLHDDVGAGLTEIAVQTDWLRRDVERIFPDHVDEAEEGSVIERATRVCQSSIDLIRSVDAIVWAVNPQNDTLDRFVGYLTQSVDQFVRAAGIGIRFDVPDEIPPTPLSGRVRHNLYLIVREAINNAVKHSGCQLMRLAARIESGILTIAVDDDGCGFIPAARRHDGRHSGLDNMQRRCDDIGGRLAIDQKAAGGVRVTVSVPLA
jgi:signal transduction histidine kinase